MAFPDEFNVQLEVHLRHVVQEARLKMLSSNSEHNAESQAEMDDEERQRQEQWRQEVLEEENEARNRKNQELSTATVTAIAAPEEEETTPMQSRSSPSPSSTSALPTGKSDVPNARSDVSDQIDIEIGTGIDPFRQNTNTHVLPEQSAFSREFVAFPSDNLLDSSDADADLTVAAPPPPTSQTDQTAVLDSSDADDAAAATSSFSNTLLDQPTVESTEVSIDPNLAWSSFQEQQQQQTRPPFEEIPL